MDPFKDRESSFEDQYAHEDRLSFDVEARCSKLFGLWAAEKLGLEDAEAKTYALEVVNSNLDEPGFDDVLRKVRGDFEQKGVEVSEHEMHVELDKALNEAKKQLTKE